MKIGVILLSVACFSLMVFSGVIGYLYVNDNQQLKTAKSVIQSQDAEIAQLNLDYSKLVADNVKYMKQSNLKSFATAKDLERFLKADSTDQEYSDAYTSEASIALMVNAREQGYWMGIGALNSSQENMLTAMLKERQGLGNDITWGCYNIAIVGDSEVYFVDPQNDAYALKIMVMSGDFLNYTGKSVNFQ
jgi:hypothetical protein